MAPVNQFEDEYAYLKQNTSSEQSKSHQLSLRSIITNVYQLGIPTKTDGACGGLPCFEEGRHSLLDIVLLSQWEDHAWKGHLRYDVSSCQMKVITGGKKFIAQLNENWCINILMDLEKKIFQSLSPIRSSYMKTHREDVLFCVSCGEKEGSELVYSTVLPKDGILIIANANPVEYGHIFLVPYDVHQMPQFLDKRVLGLMSQITAEVANRSFHIFFDYDASRSLDHKCFQACYFADPLPVELLPTTAIYGNLLTTGLYIGEVADYPLKAVVFVSKNLKALVEIVGEMCSYLHDNGTAFSLLISDCGTRIFLFPQVYTLLGYRLSTWECGGYFVYDAKSDFNDVTEVDISKLLASVSLDVYNFKNLMQQCCNAAVKLIL
ncbi:GDP-L-galactose phosphorylase 1-like [Musa acuminata AAA Group]|uniref:GDP-L-galactose phosphorylase 1-like n=1 Tax=Musa acuminata AAA Group TaxID=214697 RepID=UPI0031D19DEE